MSISEIRAKLNAAEEYEEWIQELAEDPRKGVQTLLGAWQRKQLAKQKVVDELAVKLAFDASFRAASGQLVAGTDEAGRGPLAGPVVTAAVILPENCRTLIGLDDSKQLSKVKREAFADEVRRVAISYAVHIQSVEEIDRLNIYEATKQSMEASVAALSVRPDVILADAMQLRSATPCHSIIKGDAKSLAIAAASVLAKTERDQLMEAYDETYPGYDFTRHAGYGTAVHLAALELLGPSPIHRKTFEPIRSMQKNANLSDKI